VRVADSWMVNVSYIIFFNSSKSGTVSSKEKHKQNQANKKPQSPFL
jgi:hypothetical protein